MIKNILALVGALSTPAVVYLVVGGGEITHGGADGEFLIPSLSTRAQDGREHFAAHCGACHGAYGEGSDIGPMLVHALYGSSVFPDEEILRSVREGAVARNWPFGDMPPIEGTTDDQMILVIDFIREVQAGNGIE